MDRSGWNGLFRPDVLHRFHNRMSAKQQKPSRVILGHGVLVEVWRVGFTVANVADGVFVVGEVRRSLCRGSESPLCVSMSSFSGFCSKFQFFMFEIVARCFVRFRVR